MPFWWAVHKADIALGRHPSKQGLKPVRAPGTLVGNTGSRPTSIKTRIETQIEGSANYSQNNALGRHPSKQGLKLWYTLWG